MKIVPSDARRELYGLQVICAGSDISYSDLMWARREAEKPQPSKSLCNWPMVSGPQVAEPPQTALPNVTQIKKAGAR